MAPESSSSKAPTLRDERTSAEHSMDKQAVTGSEPPIPTATSEKTPSSEWTTNLHCSCPECHHWHNKVPVKMQTQPYMHNRVKCEKCGRNLFGLGGNYQRWSMSSQQTIPGNQTAEPNSPNIPSSYDSDLPAEQPPKVRNVRQVPDLKIDTLQEESPPATLKRPRSVSNVGTSQEKDSFALSPSTDPRLLSPNAAKQPNTTRSQATRSFPSTPRLGPQDKPVPSPTTKLRRTQSLRDSAKKLANRFARPFGYELRRIERPSPDHIGSSHQPPELTPDHEGRSSNDTAPVSPFALDPPGLVKADDERSNVPQELSSEEIKRWREDRTEQKKAHLRCECIADCRCRGRVMIKDLGHCRDGSPHHFETNHAGREDSRDSASNQTNRLSNPESIYLPSSFEPRNDANGHRLQEELNSPAIRELERNAFDNVPLPSPDCNNNPTEMPTLVTPDDPMVTPPGEILNEANLAPYDTTSDMESVQSNDTNVPTALNGAEDAGQ